MQEPPESVDGATHQKEAERAFVVQFDPIADGRGRLRGRVELIASGETMRFGSLKQLQDFMAATLRRRAAGR